MGDAEDKIEIPFRPGLEKVPVAISQVCYLDGDHGVLEYRGYPIAELAQNASFEEASYLLLFSKLPTRAELDSFTLDLVRHRRLKFGIVDMLKCLPDGGHPMHALQAAVAAMGMFYPG